jgi:HK97 family phage prohead protease
MLTRLLTAQVRKGEDGRPVFRITDESKDRHGTIIKMDGWDLSAFRNSPAVFYQHLSHSDNPDHALGTGELIVKDGSIDMVVNFEPEDLNPLAHKLARKIDFGTISMVSVGFNPSEWSWGNKDRAEDPDTLYFRKQELLEVSIVHIGSNKNAHNKMIDQETIGEFVKMARAERTIETQKEIIEDIKAAIKPDEHTGRMLQLRLNTL